MTAEENSINILQFKSKLSPNQYYMLAHENEVRMGNFVQEVISVATADAYNIYKNQELILTATSRNQVIGYLGNELANKEHTVITTSNSPYDIVIKEGNNIWYARKL